MTAITTVQRQPSDGACPERALGVEWVWLILAAKHHEEAVPVVLVHPTIQQRVGKRGAHGDDVENRVNQFVLRQHERQVQVTGQLDHMERQPADGKHHHHQRQHLCGLLTPFDAVVATGGADVILELDPDADVCVADNRQGDDVLQEQHGQAVDDAAPAGALRPVLRADGDTQVNGGDLLLTILPEYSQGGGQDGRGGPGERHDDEAGVPGEAAAEVEDDAAVALQGDDGQGEDGHVHAQGLGEGHHVAQHRPELPLVQQSVNQGEGKAEGVNQQVGQRQVSYEEVCDRPHVPVANDHVDDERVAQQPQQDD